MGKISVYYVTLLCSVQFCPIVPRCRPPHALNYSPLMILLPLLASRDLIINGIVTSSPDLWLEVKVHKLPCH